MESLVLTVKGMSCNHCKMAVERALQKLPGVSQAEANVSAGTVAVTFDEGKVSLAEVKQAITDEGYEVL
ncbi:MAG TPA: heavy-metal-associated domain-containing protein [Clostridia bacterium]|nr:heavy-metal-associated domain-containing protein [Clostridia bacterium]